MEGRFKKIRIIDLASKEYENHFRLPPTRFAAGNVAMDSEDLASEPAGTNVSLPNSPKVIIISDKLPLYSEDEKYKGDYVDEAYQCFILIDNVYVSHFTCDSYLQLRNHMFFVHA